ncbi:hypothetical protein Nepgr_024094 [Nepenthes gracilis]|uniref:Uncharacterized protein n=1 Tax=Nepenthes gracilis TaxID=150966 RepID=A0AAD3T5H8_NEPGR|nr:hypothetical protein Nepgr_024094 [Nepenthes gracilis]
MRVAEEGTKREEGTDRERVWVFSCAYERDGGERKRKINRQFHLFISSNRNWVSSGEWDPDGECGGETGGTAGRAPLAARWL